MPASAISYAPYGDSVFVVGELEDPKGEKYRGVKQQFVKLGASRGDQVAVLSGLKAGQEVVTSGAFKLRNGAAVRVNNDVAVSQRPRAPPGGQLMKITDIFVKRPVLAIVVNLVILIAGLQSIRSLSVRQYPRSDIAVVRVTTAYVGASADLVRGFITTPAGARDRQRGRHRLRGVVERAGGEHDHRPPEAQLRHQRRPHPDPGQGGAGAQRPAPGGGGADHRAGDRGHPVRGHVHRLLLRRAGPEPDHATT